MYLLAVSRARVRSSVQMEAAWPWGLWFPVENRYCYWGSSGDSILKYKKLYCGKIYVNAVWWPLFISLSVMKSLLNSHNINLKNWKDNCASITFFCRASTSTEASLPRVTASVLLLKVMRGSSGPGEGSTTNGEEGAAPQSTVGGYWAPEGGAAQDWTNWGSERDK